MQEGMEVLQRESLMGLSDEMQRHIVVHRGYEAVGTGRPHEVAAVREGAEVVGRGAVGEDERDIGQRLAEGTLVEVDIAADDSHHMAPGLQCLELADGIDEDVVLIEIFAAEEPVVVAATDVNAQQHVVVILAVGRQQLGGLLLDGIVEREEAAYVGEILLGWHSGS